MPAQLAYEVVGKFHIIFLKLVIMKEFRILSKAEDNRGQEFEVSVKLDGSSMSVYRLTVLLIKKEINSLIMVCAVVTTICVKVRKIVSGVWLVKNSALKPDFWPQSCLPR